MLKRYLPFLLFGLAILFFIYLALIFFSLNNSIVTTAGMTDIETTAIEGDLVQKYSPNDTLPHYIYRRIDDSLKQIEQRKNYINESFGTGWSTDFIGFREINDNALGSEIESNSSRKYYLLLPNYKPVDFSTTFFIDSGSNYLNVPKYDRISKNPNVRHGLFEKKHISFRYSNKDHGLLIPVIKANYTVWSSFFKITTGFYIFFTLALVILFPARILLNIGRGKPFAESNIQRLSFLSFAILTLTLLKLAIPFIMHFIFKKYMVPEIQYDYSLTINNTIGLVLLFIVVYTITIAFKRGAKLQQEQDLTI
jgi:hypothetical protein